MRQRWRPLKAQYLFHRRPAAGNTLAISHGVFEVLAVDNLNPGNWSDEDHTSWEAFGRPEWESWDGGPYRLDLRHIGGVDPLPGRNDDRCGITVHQTGGSLPPYVEWAVYPDGRWPRCSCCDEPMPCRAELADQQVAHGLAALEVNEKKLPGGCWVCSEPITHRQESVVYAGDNLDLPGGPIVRFHTRQKCRWAAERYEERWLAAGEGRRRILTFEQCPGTLLTHQDGTQECFGGLDTCIGPDHAHRRLTACYMQSHGCGHGCGPEGHPGAKPAPIKRPKQRALLD